MVGEDNTSRILEDGRPVVTEYGNGMYMYMIYHSIYKKKIK